MCLFIYQHKRGTHFSLAFGVGALMATRIASLLTSSQINLVSLWHSQDHVPPKGKTRNASLTVWPYYKTHYPNYLTICCTNVSVSQQLYANDCYSYRYILQIASPEKTKYYGLTPSQQNARFNKEPLLIQDHQLY